MTDRSFTIPLDQDHTKLVMYLEHWHVEHHIFHGSILMVRGELHYQVFQGILSHLVDLGASINDAEGEGHSLLKGSVAWRAVI